MATVSCSDLLWVTNCELFAVSYCRLFAASYSWWPIVWTHRQSVCEWNHCYPLRTRRLTGLPSQWTGFRVSPEWLVAEQHCGSIQRAPLAQCHSRCVLQWRTTVLRRGDNRTGKKYSQTNSIFRSLWDRKEVHFKRTPHSSQCVQIVGCSSWHRFSVRA